MLPRTVAATGRSDNAQRLSGIPGVIVPEAVTLPRALLAAPDAAATLARHGFEFPLLIRTPGFHTGRHFLRVEAIAELPAALAELPGERSDGSPLPRRARGGWQSAQVSRHDDRWRALPAARRHLQPLEDSLLHRGHGGSSRAPRRRRGVPRKHGGGAGSARHGGAGRDSIAARGSTMRASTSD